LRIELAAQDQAAEATSLAITNLHTLL
jgi:hypothetical protein